MTIANWKTQSYGNVLSLLFNNPKRVIRYMVRDEAGNWQDRSQRPAPVRRLYETEATPERTCLRTVQFVHHVVLPPEGRHVNELHIHPDAEELVVILRGQGAFHLWLPFNVPLLHQISQSGLVSSLDTNMRDSTVHDYLLMSWMVPQCTLLELRKQAIVHRNGAPFPSKLGIGLQLCACT